MMATSSSAVISPQLEIIGKTTLIILESNYIVFRNVEGIRFLVSLFCNILWFLKVQLVLNQELKSGLLLQ